MIEINKTETGKRIRELREAAAETQEDLAKHLDVKRQIISYYENGTRVPNLEHLLLIACHYNTTTDYLLCLSDVPTADKDIKFICDYLGLDEKSIQSIKTKDNIMMSTRTPFEYSELITLFFDEYINIYRSVLNQFLQSKCFLDIISNCAYEKLIETELNKLTATEINKLNKTKFTEINENPRMAKSNTEFIYSVYEKIADNYEHWHKLNLFCLQDSVTSFAKSLTEIENIILEKQELIENKAADISNLLIDLKGGAD